MEWYLFDRGDSPHFFLGCDDAMLLTTRGHHMGGFCLPNFLRSRHLVHVTELTLVLF